MSKLVKVLVAAAVAALPVIGVQGPASASIENCQRFQGTTWANSYCSGSYPSIFQTWIVCRYITNTQYTNYGPARWAGEGLWSPVHCNSGSYRVSSGVNTWE